MPKLTIRDNKGCVELDVAKNKSILVAALEASLTMEHACGGKALCSTCVIEVISSGENLTPISKQEKDFLMNSGERLSCQAKILGDVSIRIPEFRRKDARESKGKVEDEGLLNDSLGRGGIGN